MDTTVLSNRGADGYDEQNMTDARIPQHPVPTTVEPFDALGLSAPILQSIREVEFEHPTPIQAAVIPPALQGRDIIVLAQTGSGKTAAFVIPLAEKLQHGGGLRVLIVCPTREIALQTQAFIELFGKNHDLNAAVLIGGVKMKGQLRALAGEPDIVVATPGRLLDHINRRTVRVDRVEELDRKSVV